MKRAFIIHGWEGYPEEAWIPWLKSSLEERGYEVQVPAMPDTDAPEIGAWVSALSELVGEPDADTYLVGHSIGVQTIMRYLENIENAVGGFLGVAGFFTLIPESFETDEERKIAEPWLSRPIDTDKVKRNAKKIAAVFSDDDPCVSLENKKMFEERLGAKTLVLHNVGHLGASEGFTEVPEILQAVVELAE